MLRNKSHAAIQKELADLLSPAFSGIQIEVGHNERWGRTCLTFRWEGFAEVLPEERFRRLLLHIPEEFREKHLRDAVWLELAPNETVDDYLALPRSEDITDKEHTIARRLIRSGFLEALQERLGPVPVERCMVNFSVTKQVLKEQGFSPQDCREAYLLFIRHGAYSDCEVLLQAKPSILALEKPS